MKDGRDEMKIADAPMATAAAAAGGGGGADDTVKSTAPPSPKNKATDWVWKEEKFLLGDDDLCSYDSFVFSRGEYRDGGHWCSCKLCPELGVLKRQQPDDGQFELSHGKTEEHVVKANQLLAEKDDVLRRHGQARQLERHVEELGSPALLESTMYRYIRGRITFDEAVDHVKEYEKNNPQARFGVTYG